MLMHCHNCKHSITPGMELVLTGPDLRQVACHCPYCLEQLSPQQEAADDHDVCVQRHELRRSARVAFIDHRVAESPDGQLHCPVCDHQLNKGDELLWRNSEYFKCHLCCHDLATHVYRAEVYSLERWLPIVFALGDLRNQDNCAGCSYFGAIAAACKIAFSWMPKTPSKAVHQIESILRRADWRVTDCDSTSCFAVKRYRELVGEALLLL